MQVNVDPDRCQGHGQCYPLAPEVFELRDDMDGHSVVVADPVPAAAHEAVRRAVVACPERAISIAEDEAGAA